jgi:hypothetical protein
VLDTDNDLQKLAIANEKLLAVRPPSRAGSLLQLDLRRVRDFVRATNPCRSCRPVFDAALSRKELGACRIGYLKMSKKLIFKINGSTFVL